MLMMTVDEQDEHKELVVGWPNREVGSKILIIHILDPKFIMCQNKMSSISSNTILVLSFL